MQQKKTDAIRPVQEPIERVSARARRVRRQIDQGVYETPERLELAADRLIDKEMPAPAWST